MPTAAGGVGAETCDAACARFRHGQEEYLVGGHPLWQVLRGMFQMKNQPLVVGGLSLIAGYASAWVTRRPSPIPSALREFHRREQMDRLRRVIFKGAVPERKGAAQRMDAE